MNYSKKNHELKIKNVKNVSKKVIDKTVNLDLVGVNGNAFAIMGVFKKQALREGWTQEEIDTVLTEAKSGDYNYLLATISNHFEAKDEDNFNTENYDD